MLSPMGQNVLPEPVREHLHRSPGDDFEVAVEGEDTITLRRVSAPPNRGLVDLLLACPAPFEIPPRECNDSRPPAL